jgi:hypothetical protein
MSAQRRLHKGYIYAGDDPLNFADPTGYLPVPGKFCGANGGPFKKVTDKPCHSEIPAPLRWAICMTAGEVGGSTPGNAAVNQFIYCSLLGGWKNPTQP